MARNGTSFSRMSHAGHRLSANGIVKLPSNELKPPKKWAYIN
jgi:hypothetical protein